MALLHIAVNPAFLLLSVVPEPCCVEFWNGKVL